MARPTTTLSHTDEVFAYAAMIVLLAAIGLMVGGIFAGY